AGLDHFRATDLVIEHIEKYWCPTITSPDLLAGAPFSFREDKRPNVVMLIGEDEYETKDTLPPFGDEELATRGLRVTTVHSSKNDLNDFPGVDALKNADLLLVSVRRRTPTDAQLTTIREFVKSGKPVVGIRTASHAFSLRDGRDPPAGHAAWPEFDAQILGGHYTGHHEEVKSDKPSSYLKILAEAKGNPILQGVSDQEFSSKYSLYKTSPLAKSATPLMMGRVEGLDTREPTAWTNQPSTGNRVFYTSMGGKTDFDLPEFRRLLTNGIFWALDKPVPAPTIYPASATASAAGGK
ncbi:MAG TPA: ThuA domain-containing protein, partial [Pirellulales bacterium]